MKQLTGRVLRLVLSALTVVAATVGLSPQAFAAGNRDWLRPDATGSCVWDGANYWVQRCDVWSPSMNRNIAVLIQPSSRGGDAGYYLLDGARASENFTGWTYYSDAQAVFAPNNLNLIMPIGGPASFYTDWDFPAKYEANRPIIYKWETFLTQELPVYLQQQFHVNPKRNSIAGISMGGTAAMNLAAKHPDQFQQVLSWSGYLSMTQPGMWTLLRLGMLEIGGFNINSMYTSMISPRRFENDPFWNMGGLRNTDIYIAASTGAWTAADWNLSLKDRIAGWILEYVARNTTAEWEMKARAEGLRVTTDYMAAGVHNWGIWSYQMHVTHDRVVNFLNAW